MVLRTDSYALETNVHFPTDLNLLWNSLRKCLDTIEALQKIASLTGWRKIKNIRKMLKSLFRATSHQVFKCKDEQQKKHAIKQYLHQARLLEVRAARLIKLPPAVSSNEKNIAKAAILIIALDNYKKYVTKFTN